MDRRLPLIWLLVACCALAACGGDDTPTSGVTTGAGGDGSGGDGTIAAEDTAGGDPAASDVVTGDAPAGDAAAGDATAADAATGDASSNDATTSGDAATIDSATSGDAATSDITPIGDIGCAAAADCIALCTSGGGGGGDCLASCLAKTQGKAQSELLYLLTCIDNECTQGECKGKPAGCVDSCIGKRCLSPLLVCLDDGTTGASDCAKGAQCVEICKSLSSPWSCFAGCYNGMNDAGQAGFDAVAACYAQAQQAGNKPDDVCFVQIATCYAGDKAGTGQCWDVFGCIESCKAAGTAEDLCGLSCVGALTKEGQAQFAKLGPCWQNGLDPGCKDAYLACVQPQGSKDCAAVLSCQSSCQGSDQAKAPGCIFSCMHQGSQAGAKAYLDLLACEKAGNCGQALTSCATPKGNATCLQTFQCVQGCVSKGGADATGCVVGCMQAATPASGKAFADLMICDGDCKKGCGGQDGACKEACVSSKCGGLLATCSLN